MMKKTIGTRIRKLRESKDYTQENMAAELEITAGAYAKIERGETDPSITRLFQIADILKVDVTYFLKEAQPEPSPEPISLVAEMQGRYGMYATRQDVENLAQLVQEMYRRFEKLEARINEGGKKHG